MIQAYFVRSPISSLQMRNRGITWTRSYRSLKGTRRQTVDGYLNEFGGGLSPAKWGGDRLIVPARRCNQLDRVLKETM